MNDYINICPSCGKGMTSAAEEKICGITVKYKIKCHVCGYTVKKRSKRAAIKAWNAEVMSLFNNPCKTDMGGGVHVI